MALRKEDVGFGCTVDGRNPDGIEEFRKPSSATFRSEAVRKRGTDANIMSLVEPGMAPGWWSSGFHSVSHCLYREMSSSGVRCKRAAGAGERRIGLFRDA